MASIRQRVRTLEKAMEREQAERSAARYRVVATLPNGEKYLATAPAFSDPSIPRWTPFKPELIPDGVEVIEVNAKTNDTRDIKVAHTGRGPAVIFLHPDRHTSK